MDFPSFFFIGCRLIFFIRRYLHIYSALFRCCSISELLIICYMLMCLYIIVVNCTHHLFRSQNLPPHQWTTISPPHSLLQLHLETGTPLTSHFPPPPTFHLILLPTSSHFPPPPNSQFPPPPTSHLLPLPTSFHFPLPTSFHFPLSTSSQFPLPTSYLVFTPFIFTFLGYLCLYLKIIM